MPLIRKPGLGLKPAGGALKKAPGKLGLSKPKKLGSGFGGAPTKTKASSTGTFAKAKREEVLYEERRNQPFRVSITVGGSLEVYFLDKGEPWSRYEHNIGGGPHSKGTLIPCIKDSGENCPACAKEGKEGAFVMFLTAVVPVNTWTDKKTGETKTRRFAKQLFPIKIKMSKKYQRLYETHGTFRGMVLKISRDNQMDAGTGNDAEFVRMMSEAEIQKLAKAPPIKNEENRKKAIEQKLAEAFDYEKLMPHKDAKAIATMVGAAGKSAGSSDFADPDDDDDSEGSTGWGDD